MRTEVEVEEAIDTYADMIQQLCFVYMKNYSDTEDIFQDVFLKYALFSEPFKSKEHEKAWLIRVTINRCKDVLKSFFKKKVSFIEDLSEIPRQENHDFSEVIQAVLSLPEKYKVVIYLFYYEGYSASEIAKILVKNENTIYTNLSRGRQELKKILGGDKFG